MTFGKIESRNMSQFVQCMILSKIKQANKSEYEPERFARGKEKSKDWSVIRNNRIYKYIW